VEKHDGRYTGGSMLKLLNDFQRKMAIFAKNNSYLGRENCRDIDFFKTRK
jgi:hypothetical protein